MGQASALWTTSAGAPGRGRDPLLGEHLVKDTEVRDTAKGDVFGDLELLLLGIDREAEAALAHGAVRNEGVDDPIVGLTSFLAVDAEHLHESRQTALTVGLDVLERPQHGPRHALDLVPLRLQLADGRGDPPLRQGYDLLQVH